MYIHLFEDPLGFLFLLEAGNKILYGAGNASTFDEECRRWRCGCLEAESEPTLDPAEALIGAHYLATWVGPGIWFVRTKGLTPNIAGYLFGIHPTQRHLSQLHPWVLCTASPR